MRTLDVSVLDRPSRTAAEWLWPLVPIGAAVFCLSALIYYRVQFDVVQVRSAMQELIAGIYRIFGFAPAVMFFLLLLTWSSIWFVTGRLERPAMRVARLLAMALMMGVFLNLGDGGVAAASHKGAVGAWLAGCLVAAIGYYPSIVLVWVVTFASLLLATDFFFSDSFERLRHRPRTEVGVESSVTDHLRGLGAVEPRDEAMQRSAAPPAAAPVEIEPPELDFLRELSADQPTATVATRDDAEFEAEPRRRRSYFDRRREQDEVLSERDDDVDVAAVAEWGPETSLLDAATLPLAGAHRDAMAPTDESEPRGDAEAADADAEAPVAPAWTDAEPPTRSDDRDGTSMADAEQGAEDTWQPPPAPSFVALEPEPEPDELLAPNGGSREDEEQIVDETAQHDTAAGTDRDDALDADADEAEEAAVAIPRPEQPRRDRAPTPPRTPARRDDAPARQQKLFAPAVDDDLLEEAIDLVAGQSRVTAVLLQRRLRIDYQLAIDVLSQLGARGVVELDADKTQGRVVV